MSPFKVKLVIPIFSYPIHRFLAFRGLVTDQSRVLQKIGELNLKQGTSAFSKFGCKNEG